MKGILIKNYIFENTFWFLINCTCWILFSFLFLCIEQKFFSLSDVDAALWYDFIIVLLFFNPDTQPKPANWKLHLSKCAK